MKEVTHWGRELVPQGQDQGDRGIVPDMAAVPPPMPRELRGHVAKLIDPHPDDMVMPALTVGLQEAARAYQQVLARYLLPASPEVISAWFWPIGDAVEWTPAEDEFTRRLAALISVADQVPWGGWNKLTQREAMTTFSRLPSVAAVIALVSRGSEHLLRIDRALSVMIEDQSLRGATRIA